jgi:hypothetical protein
MGKVKKNVNLGVLGVSPCVSKGVPWSCLDFDLRTLYSLPNAIGGRCGIHYEVYNFWAWPLYHTLAMSSFPYGLHQGLKTSFLGNKFFLGSLDQRMALGVPSCLTSNLRVRRPLSGSSSSKSNLSHWLYFFFQWWLQGY